MIDAVPGAMARMLAVRVLVLVVIVGAVAIGLTLALHRPTPKAAPASLEEDMAKVVVAAPPTPYVYPLREIGTVHDGDTFIDAIVDLGWDTLRRVTLRVAGLDTPEVTGAERDTGLAVKRAVIDWCNSRSGKLIVESKEIDKYGRSLAVIHCQGETETLNAYLLRTGMARPYNGDKRDPWPADKLAAARKAAEAQH